MSANAICVKIIAMEKFEHSSEPASLNSLRSIATSIQRDDFDNNAYIVKFKFNGNETTTTIRILFNDSTGSDVVITNMTTLPNTGAGFGIEAIQKVLQWAQNNNFNEVRATQVMEYSEKFWIRNGFVKEKGENQTNDFIYSINKS